METVATTVNFNNFENDEWTSEECSNASDIHRELFQKINVFTMVLCFLYGFLFVFGLTGNSWVIVGIVGIVRNLRSTVKRKILNTILYIFVLSVVDILVLANIPLLICDIYFNRRLFGFYFCKTYLVVESVNKLMSVFLLTALSFERFMVVCKPNLYPNLRSPKASLIIISVICIIIVLATSPIYVNGRLNSFYVGKSSENDTVLKCIIDIDESTGLHYTFFIFVFGFVAPSSLIVLLYFRILNKIYLHFRSIRHLVSHVKLKKVTCIIFLLVLVYFACWTPFWCVSSYAVLKDDQTQDDEHWNSRVNFVYILHLFVYLNSFFNWILYAYFNKNLKDARNAISVPKPNDSTTDENSALLIGRIQICRERTLASWFRWNRAITVVQ